ncbi:MAG TPA: hypothetical protein VMJ75_27165 [Candidatus Acidoferrales bacterium]|nr:hypothetical protein [Candidatus Acidoferrales bacterium]
MSQLPHPLPGCEANYDKACAALKSRFRAPAAKSLQGIKNEYHEIQ